mmetsp:Transcript_4641/g.7880  ORF Transcript_4641/g.7880 Transcript_4641/m.7880 type:complete len:269 (+) Transcript_4641:680-1486(+)
MTASINIFTRSAVNSLSRSSISFSTSSRIFSTGNPPGPSTIWPSIVPISAAIPEMKGFTKGLIFAAFRLIIESIMPMGLDPSEASFLSSTASNSGESSSNWSFSSTTFESANDPSLSLSCFSRKAGAKKVSMIMTFIVMRICLNCLGMIPLPYKPGTSSKSILMASQFVTPPANPKRPNAKMYRPAMLSSQSSIVKRIAMPATMNKNVTTLLMFPFSNKPGSSGWYFMHWSSKLASCIDVSPSSGFIDTVTTLGAFISVEGMVPTNRP